MNKHSQHIFILVIIGLLYSMFLFSHELSTHKRKAIQYYKEAEQVINFYQKEMLYKKAIKKDKKFTEAYWKLADLYLKHQEYELAQSTLKNALVAKAPKTS